VLEFGIRNLECGRGKAERRAHSVKGKKRPGCREAFTFRPEPYAVRRFELSINQLNQLNEIYKLNYPKDRNDNNDLNEPNDLLDTNY
jgi:hypothetical protein